MIVFKDVYRETGEPYDDALSLLYSILAERPPEANISHRRMPSYTEHFKFVSSRPYRIWMLIEFEGVNVGAIYASWRNEIGIAVKRDRSGRGIATAALRKFLSEFDPLDASDAVRPTGFVANVAPGNAASLHLFEKIGGRRIQVTFELPQREEKTQ